MYINARRMAINALVLQLCNEEKVGFVGLICSGQGHVVYMRDALHVIGN